MKNNKSEKNMTFAAVDTRDVQHIQDKKITTIQGTYIPYGKRNDYPDYLMSLYNNSAQMSAIINTIADMIEGNGIHLTDVARVKVHGNTSAQLDVILRNIIFDFVLYNGFALKLIYNRNKEIAKIDYVDMRCLRLSSDETYLLYAESWNQGRRGELIQYTRFEHFEPGIDEKNPYECIFYYTGGSRANYPIPTYQGSLRAIETSIEIDRYHFSSIQNNMNANCIININDASYTDEQKTAIERKFRENFSGSTNGSQFMLAFNDTADNQVTITRLSDDGSDKKYDQLSQNTRKNIFVGFRIQPILTGYPDENGGFSKTEYLEACQIYNTLIIKPLQRKLATAFKLIFGVDTLIFDEIDFTKEATADMTAE